MNNKLKNYKILNDYLIQIKKEFPEITWKNTKLITDGCDNNVIVLDSSLVFRFPKKSDTLKKLKSEITILNTLNKIISLNIPQIIYLPKKQNFIGYHIVNGTPIPPQKILKILSKNQIINFKKELVSFLRELHSKQSEKTLKKLFTNQTKTNPFDKLKSDAVKYLFPILNEDDTDLINNFLLEYKNILSDKTKKTITHGDLSWEHLLFNKKKALNGIIDFSDVIYDDPAIDFSPLWGYDEKFIKSVCKQYDQENYKEIYSRSKIYYKKIAIVLMIESLKGGKFNFEGSYKMFVERFY